MIDHLISLISKEFEKRIKKLGEEWNEEDLLPSHAQSSTKNGVTEAIMIWSRLLQSKWKAPFNGFLNKKGKRSFSISRCSPTRYCSFEFCAGELSNHLDDLLDWLEVTKKDLEHSEDLQVLLKIHTEIIQKIIKYLGVIGYKFSKRWMKDVAKIKCSNIYNQYVENKIKFLQSLLRDEEKILSFFEENRPPICEDIKYKIIRLECICSVLFVLNKYFSSFPENLFF